MMTLNRESKLVKWAYLLEDATPSKVSLCQLFWRTVLLTPLKILGIGAVIGLLLMLSIYLPVFELFHSWWGVLFVPTGILVFWLVLDRLPWAVATGVQGLTQTDVYQAVKGRFCPIITLVSHDNVDPGETSVLD